MSNLDTDQGIDLSKNNRAPFTVIPNEWLQSNICPHSKVVAFYLESLPPSWKPHPKQIQKSLGIGDTIWRKVSQTLRKLKVLTLVPTSKGSRLVYNGLTSILLESPALKTHARKNDALIKETLREKKHIKKSYDHAVEPVDKFTKATKVAKEKIEGLKAKIKKDDFKRNKIKKEEEKKPVLKAVAKRSKASPYASSLTKGKRLDDYVDAFSNDELKCYEDMIEMGVYKKEAIGIVIYHPIFEIVGILDDMKKYKIDNKGAYLREALKRIREKRET